MISTQKGYVRRIPLALAPLRRSKRIEKGWKDLKFILPLYRNIGRELKQSISAFGELLFFTVRWHLPARCTHVETPRITRPSPHTPSLSAPPCPLTFHSRTANVGLFPYPDPGRGAPNWLRSEGDGGGRTREVVGRSDGGRCLPRVTSPSAASPPHHLLRLGPGATSSCTRAAALFRPRRRSTSPSHSRRRPAPSPALLYLAVAQPPPPCSVPDDAPPRRRTAGAALLRPRRRSISPSHSRHRSLRPSPPCGWPPWASGIPAW